MCRRCSSAFIPLIFLSLIGSTRIAHAQQRSLLLQVDAPSLAATVETRFLIAGWALDRSAVVGTNVDAVHVWAFPVTGAPIFLGAAVINLPRPDVAAVFGARFQKAGFNLIAAQALRPGAYTLQVSARRASTGRFDVVKQVPITVRGITLSDLGPCAAGQGPQFDGTSWVCATNRGAIGPTGPPGPIGPTSSPYAVIEDATGVEVGPLIGIGADTATMASATTILENSDGRLFPVTVRRDRLFTLQNELVYFSGIDCTGTAYLQIMAEVPSIFGVGRTVITGPGMTVYTATGRTLPDASFRSWRQNTEPCVNVDGTIGPSTEAEIISRWAGLQPPFSVRRK